MQTRGDEDMATVAKRAKAEATAKAKAKAKGKAKKDDDDDDEDDDDDVDDVGGDLRPAVRSTGNTCACFS